MEMFNYCKKEIKGITYHYVSKENMILHRENLTNRLNEAKTLPGTRSYHQYSPLSITTIATKRVSEETDYSLKFDFKKRQENTDIDITQINPPQYIVCIYDENRWIGLASEIDIINVDVQVKFMHPPYPSRFYMWPRREDVCWIPLTNILCKIKDPSQTSTRGRKYCLNDADISIIENFA